MLAYPLPLPFQYLIIIAINDDLFITIGGGIFGLVDELFEEIDDGGVFGVMSGIGGGGGSVARAVGEGLAAAAGTFVE